MGDATDDFRRIAQGNVVSCQYWDGTAGAMRTRQNQRQLVNGFTALCRVPTFPASVCIGRYRLRSRQSLPIESRQPAQSPGRLSRALARLLGQKQHSDRDRSGQYVQRCLGEGTYDVRTLAVKKAYSPAGVKAIETNFQVVAPPIYLTGYLEFQDALGKNCSEADVGQLPAEDVLKKTEDEWIAIIRRIGQSKLKNDLASYKAVMPTRDNPA